MGHKDQSQRRTNLSKKQSQVGSDYSQLEAEQRELYKEAIIKHNKRIGPLLEEGRVLPN